MGNGTSCFPKTRKKSKQHCLYIISYILKMRARNQPSQVFKWNFTSFTHAVAPFKKRGKKEEKRPPPKFSYIVSRGTGSSTLKGLFPPTPQDASCVTLLLFEVYGTLSFWGEKISPVFSCYNMAQS